MIAKSSNVSSWVIGMRSLVIDCGIILVRKSNEVEMLSSLKIKPFEDLDQKKKKSLSECCVDLHPIVLPCVMHGEHMGEVQEEHVDTVEENGELVIDNVKSEEHLKQASSEPSVGIQLKRSTKDRRPSKRYLPN